VTVLRRRQGDAPRSRVLAEIWDRVVREGWVDDETGRRIVVRVAQTWRTPVVLETARSLATALAQRLPRAEVRVDEDSEVRDVIHVAGIATTDVRIPIDWFEPSFLVTVTGIGPDPLVRLHGVLAAQTEPLRHLGNEGMLSGLVYESHRLGGSDLSIACGTTVRADENGEAWWIVSTNDVAADLALARACGLESHGLPCLQAVAAHELLPGYRVIGDEIPLLAGFGAAALPVRMRVRFAKVAASGRALARDLRAIPGNLGKIPNFARRRFAARSEE